MLVVLECVCSLLSNLTLAVWSDRGRGNRFVDTCGRVGGRHRSTAQVSIYN